MTGPTESSAPVQFTATGSSTTGPPLAGSWACRDAAGAAADCAAGVWRTATWTPAAPLAPGEYTVVCNPEQNVLSLTDLAGNPSDIGAFSVVGSA